MLNSEKTNSPEDRLTGLLFRLRNLRLVDIPNVDFDITLRQMDLLHFVGMNPGSHLQDVADGLGLTPPTVSVGIRRLEESGWLERHSDPNDGRAACFFTTQKSMDTLHQAREIQLKTVRIFLSGLTLTEQGDLLALLEKGISVVESHYHLKQSKDQTQQRGVQ